MFFINSNNQSREKILKAATNLFHIHGYHGTGLNAILKLSKAPKGSLYYHFPNGKEQLAGEAIERCGVTIAEDIQFNLNTEEDLIVSLQKYIEKIALEFEDVENIPSKSDKVPIGLLAAETALINEPLRIKCEIVFEKWKAIYITQMIDSGYPKEKAELISTSVIALIEGGVVLCLTKKSSQPLLDIVKIIPLLFK